MSSAYRHREIFLLLNKLLNCALKQAEYNILPHIFIDSEIKPVLMPSWIDLNCNFHPHELIFSRMSFFGHRQEENEGTRPISSSRASTCSTQHLQDPRTRGRESRHRRQGEHTEAKSACTGHATAGIPDICNWGWQVITSLTVGRMRTVCLVRVCLGCYARGALSEGVTI